MKKHYALIIILLLLFISNSTYCQTIFNGPKITFTKTALADWTLEENQDRITSNVWITRQNTMGLINAFSENSYSNSTSPAGTEWAVGTTADIGSLTFTNWQSAIGSDPAGFGLNRDLVLHLIDDDIFIDIRVLSWGSGTAGGGQFTYERSTDATLSIDDKRNKEFTLFPNPVTDKLNVNFLNFYDNIKIELYSVIGELILKENFNSVDKLNLDMSKLIPGVYFLKLAPNRVEQKIIKFIKQ